MTVFGSVFPVDVSEPTRSLGHFFFSLLRPNFLGQQAIKAAHFSLSFSRRNLESKDLSIYACLQWDYRETMVGDGGMRQGREGSQ